MKTIELKWHKATDKQAATYSQLKYIEDLGGTIPGCGSYTNAMRKLTKGGASEIIKALKEGETIEYVNN
jgi:imidazoleglycerol phosphate synthase glutamine amidotransferase subunit HisH